MLCTPSLVGELFKRAKKIKAIIFDVDGVLANGQIVYNTEAQETKFYHAHDGLGIKLARTASLKTGIISARESQAIRCRAKELKIDALYLGRYDKLNAYNSLKEKLNLNNKDICFLGDDLPDIPVLEQAGLPVAVQNATRFTKEATQFYTRRTGGQGAVREVIEFILHAQHKLGEQEKKFLSQV